MKTYLKTLYRAFTKHITRFLSIVLMVFVSVGFISGIGSAADKIRYALNDFYKTSNASDFIIKSLSDTGFSDGDVQKVKELFPEADVNALSSVDAYADVCGENRLVRFYFVDFGGWTVNSPDGLKSGKMPESNGEALSENPDNKIKGVPEGQKITLDFASILKSSAELNGKTLPDAQVRLLNSLPKAEVEICGVVQGPLTFGNDGEPAASSVLNGDGEDIPDTTDGINKLTPVEDIFYISKEVIPSIPFVNIPAVGATDIQVAVGDRGVFSDFSAKYKSLVDDGTAKIESALSDVRVLTLYQNYSFSALHAYADKVMLIGYVLTVAFMFVTALVVLSTMTRLLDEERSQIACLSTLGYSPAKIIFKYLLFAAIATGAGGVGSFFIGLGLSELVYYVFNYSFVMPPASGEIAMLFYLIVFAIIVVATLGATLYAGIKMTREKPSELLRPKPPKTGKKTVLEKVPFIWNRLSFKYKSTVRNVLRYLNRFIMTVVAVAISTALVMAGLALLDLCLFQGVNSPSIMMIAVVVVVFAGLLTAVVIYALTNINISERNRELATLMVLGYFDGEVAGYIYREIYIDTAVGIVFGYPASTLIMYFLFEIMGVGSYATMSWFIWLLAPAVVLLFTAAVTLILRHKIVKIDMNESLKAVD